MATIVTRETTQTDGTSPKGSPLTNAEVDTNFINLNDDKVEVSGAIIFQAKAGEALAKGDVVYVSGVSGNEPIVSKADADDASKMPAYGLAEDAANLNAAVNVVTFGTLYDLNTSGFSAGDTVYVSTTAGALTNSAPTGESSLIQNIGMVVRSHASAGSIKVGGAGRTNATPNLNDGNVFIGNASNQAVARALTGDDISGGTITSFASTGIDDNAVSTAITIDSSQDVTFTSDAKFPDNGKAIFGAGSDLTIEHNGVFSRIQENGTGSLYIQATDLLLTDSGGVDTYATFTANGAATLRYDNNQKLATTSTGIDVTGTITSDKAIVGYSRAAGTGGIVLYDDDQAENRLSLLTGGGAGINAVINQAGGSLNITDASLNAVATFNDGGNVGIGTASPSSELHIHVTGASNGAQILFDSDYGTGYVGQENNASNNLIIGSSSAGVTFYAANAQKMILSSSGNVGIGTTSPTEKLSVIGNLLLNNASGDVGIKLGPTGVEAYIGYAGSSGNLQITPRSGYNTTISSGNVGIGTSSPASKLQVAGGSILLDNNTALNWKDSVGTARTGILWGTSNQLAFYSGTDNAEKMRIDSSGRVGIGTTSPSNKLTVNGDQVLLANGELKFADATNNQVGTIRNSGGASTSQLEFLTANTERMRITSGGDLLVGKTAAGIGTDGVQIQSDGGGVFTTNGATSLLVNRRTSDGTIIDVRKDGATVGNIGVATSELYLSSGNTGLYFDDVNNLIRPTNSAGALRDNTVNLGKSDSRFKDLYLSGGAYLGGTGAANHLDDYEEGTWTPALINGGTFTTGSAVYTKIGRMVVANCYLYGFSSIPNDNNGFKIEGLPFNSGITSSYAGGSLSYSQTFDVSNWSDPLVIQNGDYIYFHFLDGSTSNDVRNANVFSGLTALIIQVIYFTA